MKKMSLKLFLAVMTFALLLSACGGAVSAEPTAGKAQAALVQFTGIIEAMDGDQWTVNGQVLTVDPSLLGGKTFNVGDTIEMEVEVQSDGAVVVKRVNGSDDDNSNDDDDSDLNGNSNDDANVNDDDNLNSNDDDDTNSNTGNDNDDDDTNSNTGNDNDDDDDDVNDNGDDDSDDDTNDNDG